MLRSALRVFLAILLVAGLWLWLGLLVEQGLKGLLKYDPLASLRAQRLLAELPEKPAGGASVLVYLGDSTCDSAKAGDPADEAVPLLGALLKKGLGGPKGLPPGNWLVYPACFAGSDAYRFESLALRFETLPVPPKVALVVVNLRSLNRLGINGFYDQSGGVSTLLPAQRAALRRAGFGFWETFGDAFRFSVPVSLLRGLAAWTRESLSGWLDPPRLVVKETDGLPGHYRTVYGAGYAINNKELDALIGVGDIFAGRGCRTLYYLAPVDRRELAAQLGPAVVAQLDAGAIQVDEALRQAGYPVLDLHALLDGGFIDLPSEHLAAAGRLAVAGRLEAWIDACLFPGSKRASPRPAGILGAPRIRPGA